MQMLSLGSCYMSNLAYSFEMSILQTACKGILKALSRRKFIDWNR